MPVRGQSLVLCPQEGVRCPSPGARWQCRIVVGRGSRDCVLSVQLDDGSTHMVGQDGIGHTGVGILYEVAHA